MGRFEFGRKGFELKVFLFALLVYPAFSNCGLKLGSGGASLNDPVPSGPIVASGSLTANSTPSGAVKGAVEIHDQGNGQYILRLDSFTFSGNGAGAILVAVATTSAQIPTAATLTLRSSSGSQNYGFSYAPSDNWHWSSVKIQDSASPPNLFSLVSL